MIHMCLYVFIQHALFWGHNLLPVESGEGWILKQPDYSSFSDKSHQMRAACFPILNPARIYHSEGEQRDSRMKRRLWCLLRLKSVSLSLSSEEPITSAKSHNIVLIFHLSLAHTEQGFDSVKPRNKTWHWKPPTEQNDWHNALWISRETSVLTKPLPSRLISPSSPCSSFPHAFTSMNTLCDDCYMWATVDISTQERRRANPVVEKRLLLAQL